MSGHPGMNEQPPRIYDQCLYIPLYWQSDNGIIRQSQESGIQYPSLGCHHGDETFPKEVSLITVFTDASARIIHSWFVNSGVIIDSGPHYHSSSVNEAY